MTTAYVTDSSFSAHDLPRHPEHAGRIEAVWEQLGAQGLAEQLMQLEPASASDAQILAVHSADHLQILANFAAGPNGVHRSGYLCLAGIIGGRALGGWAR